MNNVKNRILVIIVFVILLIIGIKVGNEYSVDASLYTPSGNDSSSEHYYSELKDRYGEDVTVFIPKTYDRRSSNKWIIFAHGSNGSNLDLLNLPGENSLLKPILDDGYIIIAPNYRNITNWGNKQGVEDIVAAIELGKNNYNLEENPYLILQSMGGLVGLNALAQKEIEPKAIVGIYPVTNLEYEYGIEHKTIPGYIESAYGISNPSEFEDKTNGYDPLNDYDGSYFKEIPMLFIASSDDKIVPKEANTDKFVKLVEGVGGNIEVIEHKGNHGDISAFNFEEILNFLNKQQEHMTE